MSVDKPIPYARQAIDDEDINEVVSVLNSEWLTIGPKVDEFEENLTDYLGTFTTVVSSGTAALHAAYKAIGISSGDEIITPPITFIATQATAMTLGAKIVFADIDPLTGNLDYRKVEELINSRTKAIVTVDYAGQPGDLTELRQISEKYNLFLIEDAAHSLGSRLDGKLVGNLADLTTFSFFSTKNIATGEGGAVSSPNREIVEKIRRFTHQGLVRNPNEFQIKTEGPWHQEVHELGLNYRLPDILCALGISQLKKIEKFKKRRNDIFEYYQNEFLSIEDVLTPYRKKNADSMWHLYPIQVEPSKRLEIFNFLRSKGILVQVNYLPAYRHPVFNKFSILPSNFPNSELFYSREISIPINAQISDYEIEYVVKTLKEYFRN